MERLTEAVHQGGMGSTISLEMGIYIYVCVIYIFEYSSELTSKNVAGFFTQQFDLQLHDF